MSSGIIGQVCGISPLSPMTFYKYVFYQPPQYRSTFVDKTCVFFIYKATPTTTIYCKNILFFINNNNKMIK